MDEAHRCIGKPLMRERGTILSINTKLTLMCFLWYIYSLTHGNEMYEMFVWKSMLTISQRSVRICERTTWFVLHMTSTNWSVKHSSLAMGLVLPWHFGFCRCYVGSPGDLINCDEVEKRSMRNKRTLKNKKHKKVQYVANLKWKQIAWTDWKFYSRKEGTVWKSYILK